MVFEHRHERFGKKAKDDVSIIYICTVEVFIANRNPRVARTPFSAEKWVGSTFYANKGSIRVCLFKKGEHRSISASQVIQYVAGFQLQVMGKPVEYPGGCSNKLNAETNMIDKDTQQNDNDDKREKNKY